ncbi:MAG: TolC family protein [Saprospiraceae bacterium]
MRNNFLTLLLLIFGISANAQNVKSFTLDEAIAYALTNSYDIKNAHIGIADADQLIKENKAIGMPQVSGSLGYSYSFKLPETVVPAGLFTGMPIEGEFEKLPAFGAKNRITATIDASFLAFDYSYLTALKAARTAKNMAFSQKEQAEMMVKNQVREAYLPPLILEETKKTLQKNIVNLEKLFFETKELYKAGFVEQLDVDRLELSLANLNTEVNNLDRQKELVYNVLKFTMNYPADQSIVISDDINRLLVDADSGDLEGDINYSTRAEYRVAQQGQILQDLNVSYIKSTYYPNLVTFAQYQQTGQSGKIFQDNLWTDLGVVGLSINVPIYSGGAKKAKLQRAKLDLEKSNNQLRSLERVIWMEVGNARIAYSNAVQRVADQQKNLDLAQRIYDTTQIKYKEGVGSSLEITQAEQALFQSQQNVIQARYELLLAKVDLDQALGK